MSNRPSHHRPETSTNRGFNKTQKQKFVPSNPSSSEAPRQQQNNNNPAFQKKFVPKTPSSSAPRDLNTTNPMFSTSLRQRFSCQPDSVAETCLRDGAAAPENRIRLGENGEWVSSRSRQVSGGNFVNYLPQDEAVAAGLGADDGGLDPVESQRVVDILNRELSRLLRLTPKDFWREVAMDASLHDFLNSFLQFRSRWYDFPYHGSKGLVAGLIVGEVELSRRVFMVLYRISSNKDPGACAADSLSSRDHAVLLQDKGFLDLPNLLDICAIYGHENKELTKSLIVNAIEAQPGLHRNFIPLISHLMGIVHTIYQRCSTSLKDLISGGGHGIQASSTRHTEYLEVVDFLNDAIVSTDAFVDAYKPSAVFFSCPIELSHGNEELVVILARLYDSLMPQLQQGLQIILGAGGDTLQNDSSSILADTSVSLKILSRRIVDLGWKLVDYCYLSDEVFRDSILPAATKMFPANVEDPIVRADIIVQTVKEIAAVSQHTNGNHYRGTYLQNIEKNYQVMRRIESLQSAGWIQVDGEQYQYLSRMLTLPMSSIPKKSSTAPSTKINDQQIDEDAAIMESKISQIKDLLPDYGKGFLAACLEVYNHDPEEVIQRILDGTLHHDLHALDRALEVLPPKPTASVSSKGKGKSKLVESTQVPTRNTASVDRKEMPEATSSSSMPTGKFVRKSRVDDSNHDALNSTKDEKHMKKTAALLLQYEYEDEYDDSFDDLGTTVMDSGAGEPEIMGDRIRSGMQGSSWKGSGSSAANPSASSRWGSKKQPQYYVKDGKNYSYKVEGAVAVANYKEATMVNQAQKEAVYGLGRGGNLPFGAAKKMQEASKGTEEDLGDGEEESVNEESPRGRGRGRGRRGRGGSGNHHRKDRAMKKHFAGLGGL